ncbi:MAG: Omp28-related outer membrane protein [Bacteroidota bacterium]|nr:Omp28-related outer membrane protein [Bacteroidota bacterium]
MKNKYTSSCCRFKLLFLIISCYSFLPGNTVVASGTVYLNQDFDNTSFPPAGWQVSNTSNYNWIRTTYASGYGAGSSCAVADFYDYASGVFELITSTIPATTSGDSLVFDHAYASGSNENDRLEIYTSSDNGSSWNLLITLNGGASGPLATGSPTYDLFVPTSTQWATKRYILPTGTNKVKFSGLTAYGNNLYLDNVKIGVPYANDAGISSITEPKWSITPQSLAPKASVKNYGTSTQSFQVTMTINPGGYANTQSVNSLSPGQSQLITFSNFNFTANGNYTLKVYSSLGSDQNLSNDTVSNNLIVTSTPRNIVLEYCTGTWCQWCPCGDDEVHNLKTAYPNSVILAYHGAGSDPWRVFNGNGIISSLGFAGYPSGLVDRRLGNNNGWGSFYTDGEYRYSQSPAASVSINPTSINYNASTRQLTVNLDAAALSTLSGQYKVNYIITEDNLVYPQTGNSYCTGSSTWVHNWVVRNITNTVTGDNVNSGTWNSGQVYPLTFTTTIDAGWVAANCKFQVVIFKENGPLSVSEVQQGISLPFVTTGINTQGTEIPDRYELSQNYPNPFNPTTNIKFSVPKDGNVSLRIYDVLGKLAGIYFDGFIKAGVYNAQVDASDFTSGIYFYTLSSKEFSETKKMNLIK